MAKKKKKDVYAIRDLSSDEAELLAYFRETGTVPPKLALESNIKLRKVVEKYRNRERLYKQALQEIEQLTTKVDILSAVKDSCIRKSHVKLRPKKQRGKSLSIAVVMACDWHYELSIEATAVNELNEFNMEIANRRIERLFDRIAFLVKLHRAETTIDTLILGLLGDLMSGFIHEDLVIENQATPTEVVLPLVDIIRGGINYLLDECKFKMIHVPCCVGNHGRTTKKKSIQTAHKQSYERIIYDFLAYLYRDHPNVKFQLPEAYHVYVDPFGDDQWTIRFHHGDAIQYRGGIGGITIPVNKKIDKWSANKPVYVDMFGHFHQLKTGGHWICGPALCGYDSYALSIGARMEKPRQCFSIIESRKGLTYPALPIILE